MALPTLDFYKDHFKAKFNKYYWAKGTVTVPSNPRFRKSCIIKRELTKIGTYYYETSGVNYVVK